MYIYKYKYLSRKNIGHNCFSYTIIIILLFFLCVCYIEIFFFGRGEGGLSLSLLSRWQDVILKDILDIQIKKNWILVLKFCPNLWCWVCYNLSFWVLSLFVFQDFVKKNTLRQSQKVAPRTSHQLSSVKLFLVKYVTITTVTTATVTTVTITNVTIWFFCHNLFFYYFCHNLVAGFSWGDWFSTHFPEDFSQLLRPSKAWGLPHSELEKCRPHTALSLRTVWRLTRPLS